MQKGEKMDDTISRQVAIDALKRIHEALWEIDIPSPTVPEYIEHHEGVRKVMTDVIEEINKLSTMPSAQPETVPCDDAVGRIAVQYLLAHFLDGEKYKEAVDGLRHLPSVQPMRKTGKWIEKPEYHGDDISGFIDNCWTCDQCGKQAIVNSWGMYDLSDFCPNCGADMRGGANGRNDIRA